MPLERYIKQANEQRFVIVQIEDPEPLDELDDIARVPGIDMLFFGPGDFSQGIGAPGQWDDPRIADARRLIAQAARRHGKFAGTVGSAGNLQSLITEGYRFISIGADVVGLGSYFQSIVAQFGNKMPSIADNLYGGKKFVPVRAEIRDGAKPNGSIADVSRL